MIEYYQILEIGLFVKVNPDEGTITELRQYSFKDGRSFVVSLHDFPFSDHDLRTYRESYQKISEKDFTDQLNIFLQKTQDRIKREFKN